MEDVLGGNGREHALTMPHAPEQVVAVFSGQVQVFCPCAVMAELHCGQGQFGDGRYLNEQGICEQLHSARTALGTGMVTPQALACVTGQQQEAGTSGPEAHQKSPCSNPESHKRAK